MKVEYGKNIRVGCWYRIVEIDPHDPSPSMRAGDMLLCAPERPGCVDPENHESDGMGTQWFADYNGDDAYRTLITELEFVRGPEELLALRAGEKAE